MASYAADRYKEALTCGICRDTLTEPRTLPCLHQYCLKCLHDLVEKIGLKEGSINCPECRHVCFVPQQGVGEFKVSPTITFLLDAYKDINPIHDQKPNCNVCWESDGKNVPANMKCLDCNNKRFCGQCRKIHDNMEPHHKILKLTGDATSDFQTAVKSVKERSVFCQKHSNKPLELYCKVDRVALCYICCTTDHNGHATEDIKQTAVRNKKPIGAVITQGKELIDIYDQAIQDTQAYESQLEQNAENIKAEIYNDMNNMIQAIRKKYGSYTEKVTKKKNANVKQIKSHMSNLKLQKSIITSQVNKYCTMVEHGHPVEIADLKKHVAKKTKEWSQKPSVDFNKKLDILFKDGHIDGDNVSFGKLLIRKAKWTICEPTRLSRNNVHPSNIEGLLVTPAGDYVATGGGTSNARIYDAKFQLKKDMGHKFESAALTYEQDLAFTNRSNTIKLYQSDGTFKCDIVCKGLSSLAGITVNSWGEFVVCDTTNNKVYHIDPSTGDTTAETTEDMFEKPYGINCNSKDIIIVSDWSQGVVKGIRSDNTVLFTYKDTDISPIDLCIDECDNIFVVDDIDDKVRILNPNGEFNRCFEGPGCTLNVAIDNDGLLIIGDDKGSIHTYNYRE